MNSDPLAQLRDIHLPPPIEWWPPAPGWYVLALIVLGAVVGLLYYAWRIIKARRYRKYLIRQLDHAYDNEQPLTLIANQLLRRAARHAIGGNNTSLTLSLIHI